MGWLRRQRRPRDEAPPMVCVYLVDQVEVRGQLEGVYEDALVLSGASLEREGQSHGRRMDGTLRIARAAVDFYEVLP